MAVVSPALGINSITVLVNVISSVSFGSFGRGNANIETKVI